MKPIIATIILIILSLLSIAYVFASVITLDSNSNSMYPTINKTSKVLIKDNPKLSEIKLNDIVLFSNPFVKSLSYGNHITYFYVLHRIVGITKTGYITKGDNNNYTDDWILNKTKIEGKFIKLIK